MFPRQRERFIELAEVLPAPSDQAPLIREAEWSSDADASDDCDAESRPTMHTVAEGKHPRTDDVPSTSKVIKKKKKGVRRHVAAPTAPKPSGPVLSVTP